MDVVRSGLLNAKFSLHQMMKLHRLDGGVIRLMERQWADRFAQLLAAFICDRLLKARKKFSFETVFSHRSKVAFMKRAVKAGYKVYLYFVATNSPEINIDRVRTRVKLGGHDVPRRKIKERYHRSLLQLLPGIQASYHAFLFDNSGDKPTMFGEMKKMPNGTTWRWFGEPGSIPDWFVRAYLLPSGSPIYLHLAEEVLADRRKDDAS